MPSPFDHLHIKRRTAGSSNELSFDVLDAAANQDDAAKSRRAGRANRTASAPRASQGSYHGVAGTATLSAVPEVERRKRARRSRARRLRVAGFLALVVVAGVVAFFSYRFYQERVDFNGHYHSLVGDLTEIDKTLVQVDSLMKDPLNSVEREKRAAVLESLPDATARLDALISEAGSMEPQGGGAALPALDQVQNAAEARKDMISAASDTFELSARITDQRDIAERAWNLVLRADVDAREATQEANAATTAEATEAARAKTQEALDALGEAKALLEGLEAGANRGLTFAALKDYLAKRSAALAYAIQTSDALLANDRAAAAAANDAYNTADQQAAALAAELTTSPPEQVEFTYEDRVQDLLDTYASARARATEADASVRATL